MSVYVCKNLSHGMYGGLTPSILSSTYLPAALIKDIFFYNAHYRFGHDLSEDLTHTNWSHTGIFVECYESASNQST